MEAFLDGSSPLHWLVVGILLVSGVLTAWLGIRDGFIRREMRTNSGPIRGRKAIIAGALYAFFGLAGIVGAVLFVIRGF
jgi:hypothetical protein